MQATAGGQTQKKTAEFRAHTVVPDNLIASRYQILPPVSAAKTRQAAHAREGPTLMRADAPTPEIE
ncbi:MAG: hypothetical protein DMG70_14625 [Acidobacteria bacterium]|nr:MAG: hypothetical protein DMG70_14625 [Acidobacteriota bacterium]